MVIVRVQGVHLFIRRDILQRVAPTGQRLTLGQSKVRRCNRRLAAVHRYGRKEHILGFVPIKAHLIKVFDNRHIYRHGAGQIRTGGVLISKAVLHQSIIRGDKIAVLILLRILVHHAVRSQTAHRGIKHIILLRSVHRNGLPAQGHGGQRRIGAQIQRRQVVIGHDQGGKRCVGTQIQCRQLVVGTL